MLFSLCTMVLAAQNNFRKFDSTMKLGRAGFRVVCSNKSEEKNMLSITPVGFSNQARDVSFDIKGRVLKAEVDDLNNDNFPDLVIYVYPKGDKMKGTVLGVASINNESFMPISFPDITDDIKNRVGYVGYDQFTLMEGTLMRRFPVYTADSVGAQPTGMVRQIQYRTVPGERQNLQFKVVRSYEFKQ
ncbi:MAG: hypothetical protein EAZ62_08040 [Sphingobacteriia bacterium]|nr:MAG: hypothetical protein EAZ62_08040 [Sphingobacteriia bacterium]